jgi:hypothetical protein
VIVLPSKITRFYTFVAGKVAKSAEINAELDQIVTKYNEGVDAIIDIDTLSQQAIADSATALTNSNTAITTADTASITATNADTKADTAITTANTALGQDTVEPVTGALGAMKIATDTETALNLAMADLEDAILRAEQAVIDAQSAIGNTEIIYDVYTIVNADNGDGTFTYTINGVDNIIGDLVGGAQRFPLSDTYIVGSNRIEISINDTLTRSQASGGLAEVGDVTTQSNLVDLTATAGNGAEVTIKYFKQIGLGGRHAMSHNVGGGDEFIGIAEEYPTTTYAGQLFFKVVV